MEPITPTVIREVFGEVLGGLDALSTSAQEKGELSLKIFEAQASVLSGVVEYQSELLKAQSSVILAEATSQSWMARNWRPIAALSFTFIIVYHYIFYPIFSAFWASLPEVALPDRIWTTFTVMLGGYVVGRSVEKTARSLTEQRDMPWDVKAESREKKRLMKLARRLQKKQDPTPEEEARLDRILAMLEE